MVRRKQSTKEELFKFYWTQMKSRIVVGKLVDISQRDLFYDFGSYKIPMRYEASVYEHEFSKLFGKTYIVNAATNSSDPFYCPAFRTLNLCTKLSVSGTLVRAYLQIRINITTLNQDKSYLIKTGTMGFAAISSAAMSIQQSFTVPILAKFMDIEIIAGDPDSEMSSTNFFTVDEVVGFFG